MSQGPAFVPSTVYADFADPRSYLASLRADTLLIDGHPALVWKSVQHRPTLPRGGVRLDGSAHDIRGSELRHAHDMLVDGERCDARNPGFLPHTGPASVAHASAVGLGVGPQVRRLLFDAYWVRGLDIGDVNTLRMLVTPILQLARTGGGTHDQDVHDESQAREVARAWQQDWLKMGTPIQLTVVSPRHSPEYGTAALMRLRPDRQFAA